MALKDYRLEFSKEQIDAAGKKLLNSHTVEEEKEKSLEILSNFRSCHGYPINTFQATLRTKLNKLGVEYLVSQRLKRTPSILFKLERFPTMRLSQMQDIGGLRAILPTVKDVYRLVELYKIPSFPHELTNEKDYIENPKETGYRCYHLVYANKNRQNSNYDNLMIELQIRTKLQHAWATAVETMGTFIDHSLKSSQGPTEWLNFFSLVGNAFAHKEQTPLVEQFKHLDKKETYLAVKKEALRLQVDEQLTTFSDIIQNVQSDKKQGSLHLIVLDIDERRVNIKSYSKQSIEVASQDYLKEEALLSNSIKRQVVLVSSDSIESLKKAYPSYFLDTQEFLRNLKQIIKEAN